MKKIFSALSMLLIVGLLFTSCDLANENDTADSRQAEQTKQQMSEMTAQVGFPAIVNYYELKQFKAILERRDQADLITYTYLHNEMEGSVGQFLGQSIGYGIPAATQFTNPERVIEQFGQGASDITVPQPDPNGLFMPTSTDATWVMLVTPDGTPEPQYIEGKIDVFTFKIQ